jgi:beta-barrel assembly-enhancing protease
MMKGLKKKIGTLLWTLSQFVYILILSTMSLTALAHDELELGLPDLGNSASAVLSPAQERELGRSVVKELQAASALSQDVIVTEYLQYVGYRLLATHGGEQPQYQFFAVRDKTINAFALPGGFIGVNTGLILATESESELAGVMAHEIGHVQQKHIARMYQHMSRMRLSTIAGILAAIIIATQDPQAAQGAVAATMANAQQKMINFTRDHEKEADYVGIQTLAKAGFDPMGMPAFFHRMYQDNRYYTNRIPEYLMTHPLTENRMMAAEARAKSYPYRQFPDSLQYHLVHARVQTYSFASAHEACRYYEKILDRQSYRNRTGILYGYVLALLENNKPQTAKPYLNELLASHPNQPLFQLAYAEMQMQMADKEGAFSRIETALKNHPNNYPLLFTYGEWLIKARRSQEAISLLKPQVHHKTPHPELWNLLSAAYAQNRQAVQSHLAQAQFLKLKGDMTGANTQLRLARRSPSLTPVEQRQIEAQQKEIKLK